MWRRQPIHRVVDEEETADMARKKSLPGIETVHLPEVRQAIPYLHSYLRECILDGRLPPGEKLSQVTLSEQLGVSRTPLREVLRMLQEEGLVEIEPNQRTRVAGLDPVELDEIYARRILMESLATSMSLRDWNSKSTKEGKRLLGVMKRAARSGDFATWFDAHSRFHRVITASAGEAMQRQLQNLADRTIRYIRIYQLAEPSSWQVPGQVEHQLILDAVSAGDELGAITGMAHHLAGTATRVLTNCAPAYQPIAVPHAVALIDHQLPRSSRASNIGTPSRL